MHFLFEIAHFLPTLVRGHLLSADGTKAEVMVQSAESAFRLLTLLSAQYEGIFEYLLLRQVHICQCK